MHLPTDCFIEISPQSTGHIAIYIYAVKYNSHTHIHTGSHFGADTVNFYYFMHTYVHICVEVVGGPSRLFPISSSSFVVHEMSTCSTPIDGIRSKRPKTKTSQVICQNVPFLVSQNVPSIFSLYLIKLKIANIFCEHTGQNVPKSNRPKSKRPKVKMSQVKTSQSQNVPSQNVPESKCPRVKTSQVKISQVKMSQVKTSQSQNVPSCLSACKQHYSHSYEALSIHIKHAILLR